MFQNVRGSIDFLPEEKDFQNKVFASLRTTATNFGFKEVETPAFEYTDMLVKKSGEEIKQQIFNLVKKSKEEISLRPELTPGITRMFIEKQKTLPKPVKWFGLSRMWRYEAPQKGRLREFYQLSVECYGSEKEEADADVISLAIECLLNLGLKEDDFFIKINNRYLLQGVLESIGIKNFEDVTRIIDKKSKITEDDFEKELLDLKLDKAQIKSIKEFIRIKKIEDINKLKLNETAKNGYESIKKIIELLPYKNIRFDPSVARGLAYYTGTVFEAYDSKEKFRAILGGGRYDNLVEILGGQPCPAVGFGLGYATLSLLLDDKKLTPKRGEGIDFFIATLGEVSKEAQEIANRLRKKYSVELNIMNRNLGKQMKYADSIKAKQVIVIGEDEIKSKKLTVKDMTTGKQTKIALSKL